MELPTPPQTTHGPPSNHPEVLVKPPIGFRAWNEAERTNVLVSVHSLQAVIKAIMEGRGDESETVMKNPDHEKIIHSFLDLFSCYMEFVGYLSKSNLPERARYLQARAICLAILAGVAIFLGVLQSYTLTIVAPVDAISTGGWNNSSTVGRVIKVFAFCGVSFDALGVISALWTFCSLILTISKIEEIVLGGKNLNMKIHSVLDSFHWKTTSAPHKRPEYVHTLRELGISSSYLRLTSNKYHTEATRVVHLIDNHLQVQRDCIALTLIAAGLLFFFVSLFCFISTQPLSVWMSTTVVVAVAFIILCISLVYQQPGFRRSIIWRGPGRVCTMITKCFSPKKIRGKVKQTGV